MPGAGAGDAPIEVVLVEDHDMVAEAIALALERTADIKVLAQTDSLAAAALAVRRCQPDVILLDRRLPDGDGVAAIGGLMSAAPRSRVPVLTAEAGIAVATRVAQAGGAGLVVKSAGLVELEAAVRRVAAGETVFDGVGLREPAGFPAGPDHFGVIEMRERAETAGGWWTMLPAEPRGTAVEFWVPSHPPAQSPA